MNRFLRLIFTILIAGAAVNMSIVLWANSRSRERQVRETERNRERFFEIATNATNHLRRADLVVESQQLDAYGKALETTLLVRQYAGISSDQGSPLKIGRVRISGDVVIVDGMTLQFTEKFAEDAWQYSNLRGMTLSYFGAVNGVTDKPRGAETRWASTNESFKFMERGGVPQLTRVEPETLRPSSYESNLWLYIWNMIPETPPVSLKASQNGLEVQWLQSKPMVVKREQTYTAFIGAGILMLEENSSPSLPRLLEVMLSEGRALNGQRK